MANAGPTKIMFIRHAEKPADNPPPHGVTDEGEHDPKSLSVRGWMRAGALVNFFAPAYGGFVSPQLATPNWIYAAKVAPGSESKRHQETVMPLLERLVASPVKTKQNFEYPKDSEHELMESVMAQEGVVLICWEHARLPHAAARVPLSPNNSLPVPETWDEDCYDRVWIFDRDDAAGGYTFAQVAQLLLPDDKPL